MYAKRPGEKYYKQMINTHERVEYARYVSATDTLVEVLIRDGLTVVRITPEVSSKLVVRRTDNTYGTMAYKYDYSASQEHTFLRSSIGTPDQKMVAANGRYLYITQAPSIATTTEVYRTGKK